MTALSADLRKELERACVRGRRAGETASRAAIGALGVLDERPPVHLGDEDRELRRALLAKREQLGDRPRQVDLLVADCAYEQWHRLLFARFLAENNLLIHPQFGVKVTLAECDELAADLGEPDAWSVASRFAAEILPGIFRLDDPCVRLRLAPEGRFALEQIVEAISSGTFAADDALGWVYQHWQNERKVEVNTSERKIGGPDLAPVTQLFTEHYMVRFLLENSLGAWWASSHPDSPLIRSWEYLRFDDDGKPAAGVFEGWPSTAAEVTVMDPCCGSGHFLVEAFEMLWKMRVEEEGLAPIAAQDAALRDNLFGLELDPRCVQIAMFAVALAAWKAGGGWRELPIPNVACSGIPVKANLDEWTRLAPNDERLELALARLHVLFQQADTLGTLVDPRRVAERARSSDVQRMLDDVDWSEVEPILRAAAELEDADPAKAVLGADAASLALASDFLSRTYGLVITNPPYLPRTKFGSVLVEFGDTDAVHSKNELATMILDRARRLTAPAGGAYAFVMPQTWLTLVRQKALREELLEAESWRLLARLGLEAFASISSGYVDVFLGIWQREGGQARRDNEVALLDAQHIPLREDKARHLIEGPIARVRQEALRRNPDSRVLWQALADHQPLGAAVDSHQGIKTSDNPRFARFIWEFDPIPTGWRRVQSAPSASDGYTGRTGVVFWEDGHGQITEVCQDGATFRGQAAWGRRGVAISEMGYRYATVYTGELFDGSVIVVTPRRDADVPALWRFIRSSDFEQQLRMVNPKLSVSTSSVVKVPFDLDRWRATADEAGHLSEPWSDDLTQWLFEGRPEVAAEPLHVAISRLLGYRWPEQISDDNLNALADEDGIVCLPSVLGERTAADRLQELLALAYDRAWSPARAAELLAASGSTKRDLDDWLRSEFFKSHCQLFKNRPFIWHIWDGRRDGFGALVNYHRLDRPTLERVAYTYLGDWIERQSAGAREDIVGAEERLIAARELQRKLSLILAGEPPYDIYVRWKPITAQPIGWAPDLADGVRLNIRPFVQAGVLRAKFNVKWEKDRGKNPNGSERHNDLHISNAEKQAARGAGRGV